MVDLAALRAAIAVAMVPDPAAADGAGSVASAVCRVCSEALPVDGAAFTAMASDQARELLCASDAVIEQVQQSQFSLGEGPAMEAFNNGRPVCVPELTDLERARWPVFAPSLQGLPIGSLFAFPVTVGAITLGVVDLYRQASGRLSGEDLAAVLQVVDLAAAALLALRASHLPGGAGAWLDGAASDRQVHQATGMLIGQLGVPAEEAFARLRGYAFSQDRQIGQVAADIVARRVSLDPDPA